MHIQRSSHRARICLLHRASPILLAFLVGLVVATSISLPWSQPLQPDFWKEIVPVGAQYVEGYNELESITRHMDLVIRGSFAGVVDQRTFAPDGDAVHFAVVAVEVTETLAGIRVDEQVRSDVVLVEFLLPGGMNIERVDALLPTEEHLLFLRSKARIGRTTDRQIENLNYYTLSTQDSAIANSGGIAEMGGGEDTALRRAVAGRPFAEVLEEIRAHGAKGQLPVDFAQTGDLESTEDLIRRLRP